MICGHFEGGLICMKHHGHSGPHDVPLPQTTASAATSPGETPLIERLAAIVPQELALNHDGNPSTMRCACRDCSRDLIHTIIAALAAEARHGHDKRLVDGWIRRVLSAWDRVGDELISPDEYTAEIMALRNEMLAALDAAEAHHQREMALLHAGLQERIDAAEARLADARREALEEAARTCERRAETVPPTPVLSMKGELMCVAGAIRALAVPRHAEETTT